VDLRRLLRVVRPALPETPANLKLTGGSATSCRLGWERAPHRDLALLTAPAHHQQVHSGIWTIQIIDGIPWARPPAWIDRHRRLTRNTFHRSADAAARIGQQLRLALETNETDSDQTDAA
jgi:hypothetical protein